ncbi:MAG: hypothetical protein ITG01_12395 [Comamonas sp.]|nr:hypothetical protein [Comamonas sp.]
MIFVSVIVVVVSGRDGYSVPRLGPSRRKRLSAQHSIAKAGRTLECVALSENIAFDPPEKAVTTLCSKHKIPKNFS